nr:spermidine/putrescine ABC transporter substrate-binding protein [uncultured Anaerobutyricum sp.]
MLSIIVITAMLVTMLAGCGSKSSEGKNGELNIFIWTEYVPDSVIEKFEKETGIKVNVSTYSSNEDMLAKVKSESEGTYDIVQPSDYMVEQMASQGMLEELKTDELKNLSNIGESYLNPSYDPGNKYSVPYQGGVAGIAVNTSKVKKDITSYDDLFDSSLKNSIVALDDYRAVIGMTARSMGYSMNETDPAVLSKIQDKLLTLKNNVKLYDSDSPKSALISGDCTVGYVWSAEIALAMEENPDIKVVYPTEGAYLFMDNWAIPKGAKNYDNAVKFIDFMLDAENAQMVLEEFPYLSPNTKAVEAMGEDYSKNEAKNPPAEVIKKGEYVKNLDADTLKIYDEMWTKLKQ